MWVHIDLERDKQALRTSNLNFSSAGARARREASSTDSFLNAVAQLTSGNVSSHNPYHLRNIITGHRTTQSFISSPGGTICMNTNFFFFSKMCEKLSEWLFLACYCETSLLIHY